MDSILTIILALILSSFFSGMVIAFDASNRLIIELDKKQGVFGSGILRIFTDKPVHFRVTMLTGGIISFVIYTLAFSNLISPMLMSVIETDAVILIINIFLSATLILIVTEFLTKTVFVMTPNFFLKVLSLPAFFFYVLLYPICWFILAVSKQSGRIFFGPVSIETKQEDIAFRKTDLDNILGQSLQDTEYTDQDQNDIKIFRNALDFSNVRLKECMVPRTEIEAVEKNSSIDSLKQKFMETGYSRIIVFEETLDNITGYAELKDLLKNPPDIISAVRKLTIVPETMPASRLLKLFVDERKNIALVVDEFGGTSGMVTIEDILEEIFGEFEDEHDISDLVEKQIGENEFLFSGRVEIDYLNEKYNLALPEKDDFETLAGMILYFHGSIPGHNDVIRIGNIVVKILRSTETRLELVNLKVE